MNRKDNMNAVGGSFFEVICDIYQKSGEIGFTDGGVHEMKE